MNYLAHIYLSGNNPLVKIGNFSGDWLKGTISGLSVKYPVDMVKGVVIHRFIDRYTDEHPLAIKSTELWRKSFGKYAGVVNDVVFDHFLAKNWDVWSNEDLGGFTSTFYTLCLNNYEILPNALKPLVPHLILSDRLNSYRTIEGLAAALRTMSFQTSLPKNTSEIIEILKVDISEIEYIFNDFFIDIKDAVSKNFNVD